MLTRRQLLRDSSILALLPATRSGVALAFERGRRSGRTLLVIELYGGNDGLNTVVPWRDEEYGRVRDKLRLPEAELVKLSEDLALHPALEPMGELFQKGRLAIVQGVGYPDPSLSHFRSQAIWHHARRDPEEHDGIGWLGRALDGMASAGRADARAVFVGSGPPPVAVRGTRAMATSLESVGDFRLEGELASGTSMEPGPEPRELDELVRRNLREAAETGRRLETLATDSGAQVYPASDIGKRLELASQLLRAEFGAAILYTGQGNYDTHATQAGPHAALLGELAAALTAFLEDVTRAGRERDVAVLIFSEFGRAVLENASYGTDHGTSAPVFLAGAPVRGGILGTRPSLTELVDGQLAVQHDLRRVYAAVLERWLEVPGGPVLGGSWEGLPLLAT